MEVVTGLSLLAQLFALGYMEKDWALARFFAFLKEPLVAWFSVIPCFSRMASWKYLPFPLICWWGSGTLSHW